MRRRNYKSAEKQRKREVQLERECEHSLAKAEDLRTSNDFYKRQDSNQTQTIFNLKRLVANLQKTERNEGYIKTITTHKAEIARLVANEVRLKDEVQKHQRIAIKALERMKEQIKIANEAKKEVATYKGHALAAKHSLLVSLSHTKFELAMEIVNNVFKGLKDIDSEEKAKQAIHSINGYLEQQSKTVEDYTTNVMSNSAEVRGVIQDLQGYTLKEARPNEFGSFIDYVRGLQHTLETEAKKWKNKLNV
ncbi:hypothetical protein ACJQWK_00908 [Exserohilum turcicum]